MSATGPNLRERIGYALGDTASNLYWKLFEYFVVIYYTDVYGLSSGATGTMLLVTRGLDAIADPLMGIAADRTSTRWGKFRPYLIWFSIPLAVAGVLAFWSPPALHGSGSRLAYAYATYVLLMLCYTAINIPYSAMLGVIASSSAERTRLSAARFVGAFMGALFVQKATLDLVGALGRGQPARGWTWTLVIYGVLATLLFWLCFASTRERVAPPADQATNLRVDLRAVTGDRPFRVLFALAALIIVAFWLRGGGAAYYFKYDLSRPPLLGWFLAAGGLAGVFGAACTAWVSRLLGKKRGFRLLLGGAGLLMIAQAAVPASQVAAVFALNVAICLLLGPTAPLIWAMFADVVDHVEWRVGRRATGLVFAGALFAMKVGGALGGWGLGMLLDAFGYQANAVQSATALRGIVVAFTVVPGLVCLAAATVAARYELDETAVSSVEAALAARRTPQF